MVVKKEKKQVILINSFGPRKGKDVAVAYLSYCYGVTRYAFADPIKRIISKTLGISLELLELFKNKPEEYKVQILAPNGDVLRTTDLRKILQIFGTEAMKPEFGDRVWSELQRDKLIISDDEEGAFADFRFIKEGLTFKENSNFDVHTIHIVNNSVEDLVGEKSAHSSENELKDYVFDYMVDNSKMDNSLFEQLDAIAEKIGLIKIKSDFKVA